MVGFTAIIESLFSAGSENCAGAQKLDESRKKKLTKDLRVQECDAHAADVCRIVGIIKNKCNAICFIINETIIFEHINKKTWIQTFRRK